MNSLVKLEKKSVLFIKNQRHCFREQVSQTTNINLIKPQFLFPVFQRDEKNQIKEDIIINTVFRATKKANNHVPFTCLALSFTKQKHFLTDKAIYIVKKYRTPTSWPLHFSSSKKTALMSPIMTILNPLNHTAIAKHCIA